MEDKTLANDPFLRLQAYGMVGRHFSHSLGSLAEAIAALFAHKKRKK